MVATSQHGRPRLEVGERVFFCGGTACVEKFRHKVKISVHIIIRLQTTTLNYVMCPRLLGQPAGAQYKQLSILLLVGGRKYSAV